VRRLSDPLDGPGDKHPPGEAAGDAPQPRDTHGDLVALFFVSHVRDSRSRTSRLCLLGRTEFPLAGMGRSCPTNPRRVTALPEGVAAKAQHVWRQREGL
jgi:hypothetical protein